MGLSPILGMCSLGVDGGSVREGGRVEVGLRGRVEQQVDAIAGSANKVLAGVMDTSFWMLKSLLPGQDAQVAGINSTVGSTIPVVPVPTTATTTTTTVSVTTGSAPWNAVRPNLGLLRRESGFSIVSRRASQGMERTISRTGSRWSRCLLPGVFRN